MLSSFLNNFTRIRKILPQDSFFLWEKETPNLFFKSLYKYHLSGLDFILSLNSQFLLQLLMSIDRTHLISALSSTINPLIILFPFLPESHVKQFRISTRTNRGIISAVARSTHRGRSPDHLLYLSLSLSLRICVRSRNPLDITRDERTDRSCTATAVANTEIIVSLRNAIFSETIRSEYGMIPRVISRVSTSSTVIDTTKSTHVSIIDDDPWSPTIEERPLSLFGSAVRALVVARALSLHTLVSIIFSVTAWSHWLTARRGIRRRASSNACNRASEGTEARVLSDLHRVLGRLRFSTAMMPRPSLTH